ncbi:unnamed protein product [Cuscuta epithymum]|uniref:Uncharacterized protein n=1 Tax=Cuscuta epithymum TaxID=186058 RepID=A0AAV0EXH0_9ASTE|nr:unnamed protein product [Cuscuta epithymum]
MGKKGSWFSSVKKAFSPESKKGRKANKKRLEKEQAQVPDSSVLETPSVSLQPPPPPPPPQEVELSEVENEQTKHALSVAAATVAAAEAAVAAAQAAAEVVRLSSPNQFAGKSKDETAAIRIQTAFRGYLARRALKALRGLVRLKSLVDGPTAKRQTASALKCMQSLSRVQSQIHSRRNRMLEENRALQKQIMQKHAKELENLRRGEEWDDSVQSKEKVEANLLSKFEAAMRRERALAYSYSHQKTWKKSSRSANLLFMDPTNPQWGWSWLERWMGARPWETDAVPGKEIKNDQLSVRGESSIIVGEITKSYARHLLSTAEQPSSPSPSQKPSHSSARHSPATPPSKLPPARKLKSPSQRASAITAQDDDARSVLSVQLEGNGTRRRRHSIAGSSSSVRDDESLSSTTSVPSYMAPTRSARAKTRLQSPSDVEEESGPAAAAVPVKKRLSYPLSPASRPRRYSGPPKAQNISIIST